MARSAKKILGDETTHYESARKKRARPKAKMQPPLTPMIDVTFQLLLFFLLTFTFRQAEGQIPGSLPMESETDVISVVKKIEIKLIPAVGPGGLLTACVYEMSGANIQLKSAKELQQKLEARKAALGAGAAETVPVIIEPRDDVAWRYVVEAWNAAVRLKFKNIGFATRS